MKKIIKKALKSGGIDLLAGNADKIVEKAVDGGILEVVPIFGTIAKTVTIGQAVRDQIFEEKLSRFLVNLSDIDPKDVEDFTNEMNRNPDLHTEVGKKVLLLLERMDDMKKSEMLAMAFEHYMKGQINLDKFSLFGRAIDRCAFSSFEHLKFFQMRPCVDYQHIAPELVSCGLLRINQIPQIQTINNQTTYEATVLGKEFIQLLL